MLSAKTKSTVHQGSSSYHGEITFFPIAHPDDLKNRSKQQEARTRSILNSKKRDRQRLQEHGRHFRPETSQSLLVKQAKRSKKSQQEVMHPILLMALGVKSIDPFETLPVNAARLTELLHLETSIAAGEPIFSLGQVMFDGALHSVFGTSLCDPGLAAALYTTLALAQNAWAINRECLEFEYMAIRYLNRRLSCSEMATEATTVGIVILLLGINYRLDRKSQVVNHLAGLQALMEVYKQHGIILNHQLRRAIFWQDLLCSVVSGSERVLTLDFYPSTTIQELKLKTSKTIPSGFLACKDILSSQILGLANEIHNLYLIRGRIFSTALEKSLIDQIDTYQADVESRILDMMREESRNHLQIACILALFLCVYGFWDGVWKAALLPRAISSQLLDRLVLLCGEEEEAEDQVNGEGNIYWNNESHANLILWMTWIGRSFAVEETKRDGFVRLQQNIKGLDNPSYNHTTLDILNGFVWSDIFHSLHKGSFWEHTS